jgi:multicomponent Na+:H+ antiporter subunit G
VLRGALVVFLLAVGSFFLLVGTIGLLRLPDIYNRMHATSKASTLGAASIFLAAFAYFGPREAGLTALVGIVFLFLTAPTGAHMISRAAEKMGVPFYGDVEWPADSGSGVGTETGTAGPSETVRNSADDADR